MARGVEATTVDDIIGAVDVSRRTFFRYYETKEDAWFGSPQFDCAFVAAKVRDAPDESPILTARNAFRSLMLDYHVDRDRGLAMARLASQSPSLRPKLAAFRERMARCIASALAERMGLADGDLKTCVIAQASVWTIAAAVDRWVLEEGARALDDIIADAFACADAAFGTS